MKFFFVAFFLMQVAAEHGGPTSFERKFTALRRCRNDTNVVSEPFDERGFDPGKGPAHRPWLYVLAGKIRDHDSAGFGLPPIVVNEVSVPFLAPHHGFLRSCISPGKAATGRIIVWQIGNRAVTCVRLMDGGPACFHTSVFGGRGRKTS